MRSSLCRLVLRSRGRDGFEDSQSEIFTFGTFEIIFFLLISFGICWQEVIIQQSLLVGFVISRLRY